MRWFGMSGTAERRKNSQHDVQHIWKLLEDCSIRVDQKLIERKKEKTVNKKVCLNITFLQLSPGHIKPLGKSFTNSSVILEDPITYTRRLSEEIC